MRANGYCHAVARLSEREREIASLVSCGLSNKEVARLLDISVGTVKIHLHRIYQKLPIRNRTALALLARQDRWASPSGAAQGAPVRLHENVSPAG